MICFADEGKDNGHFVTLLYGGCSMSVIAPVCVCYVTAPDSLGFRVMLTSAVFCDE
jgi:hypothetical protein